MTQRELIGRTVTVLALIAFAWWLAWFVRQTADIFILLLIAAILAAGLAPLVGLVERWRLPGGARLPRGVAIAVVYLGVLGVIAGILSAIIVPGVSEAPAFAQNMPQFLARLRGGLQTLHQSLPWTPDLAAVLDQLPAQIAGLSKYGPRAAEAAFRVFGGIADAVAVLVFAFYMLLEGARIKVTFLALFPGEHRPRVSELLKHIGVKFGGWLRGQLLLSFIAAAGVSLFLVLLGMPFAFLLGILAGVGELIPMVGLTLSAAGAALVGLSQQEPPAHLLAAGIFYAVAMWSESHILVPRIMFRVVGMSPLLTLFALFAGIKLLGILGGLLAVPVAAAAQVIAAEIAREIQPQPSPAPLTAAPEEPVEARPREPAPPR